MQTSYALANSVNHPVLDILAVGSKTSVTVRTMFWLVLYPFGTKCAIVMSQIS